MSTIHGNILQISCHICCCTFYRWTDCFSAGHSWKYISSEIIVFKINTHTHMQAHTHTCASLNAHVHTQTHMLVCTLTCMPNCTHTHTRTHSYTHTHSLSHTHTHTLSLSLSVSTRTCKFSLLCNLLRDRLSGSWVPRVRSICISVWHTTLFALLHTNLCEL